MQNRFTLVSVGLFWAFAFQILPAQNTFYQIVGPEQVCLGDCALYIIQSPSNPGGGTNLLVTWSVSGPGGFSISSQQNPDTFCFPLQGLYLLKAQAVSANGILVVTDTLTVQVTPFIPVQIVSDNPALCDSVDVSGSSCERVCPNTTVTYSLQNSNSGLLDNSLISWSVNGAEQYVIEDSVRVKVTWGEPGAGSVSAVVFSGQCVGEDGYCVTIVEEPKAAFVTTPAAAADTLRICQGQTVWFNNQSTDADTYEWFFGDGSAPVGEVNPQHKYPNPGVYTVSLIARSGCLCADTATQVIEVLAGEAPILDCVGTVCAGATVTYSTSANCAAFDWSVSSNGAVLSGGGASDNYITIQWTQGPAGQIRLLAQNCAGASCSEAVETLIPVLDESAEIRGAERVCPGAEEVYTIEPYQGAGFVWNLSGGGMILEGQGTNRVVVRWAGFPSPGIVRRLSVQYDNCYLDCGGRDTIEVRVLSPFVLDGPVEICENSTGTFLSRLTIPTQPINSNWTVFGPDGSAVQTAAGTSLQANFTAGSGIYQIRATPVDPSQSCSDLAEWAVSVPTKPAAPVGIEGNAVICPGEPFTYRATGLPPNANVRWTIQNGAGAPGTALGNPLVVPWGASGPRELRVEVISSDGLNCLSPALQVAVAAFDPVQAVLSGPDSVCLHDKMQLQCALAAGLQPVWSIPGGGGSVISGQGSANVEIYWNVPGIHTVQAVICGQTVSRAVTVLAPPAPVVTQPAGACPGSAALVGTTSAFAGYQWQNASGVGFGQGATALVSSGDYLLTVADAFGCTGSAAFRINSYPTPNASVSTPDPTGFCNNNGNVRLRALSGLGTPPSFEWFLNGVPLGVTGSEYTANQYGSYSVIATNAEGCTAAAGPVTLFEDCGGGGGGGGVPGGGGGSACPQGAVAIQTIPAALCDTFSFTALGADYAAGSAQWFFGQSGGALLGSSAGDQAGFTFPNAGVYTVLLRASLSGGGLCEVWDTVAVQAVAQFDTLTACAGLPVQFNNISTFLPYSGIAAQSWDFGDPASGANNTASEANPQHIFAAGGVYSVSLTITALSGCTAAQSALVVIPEGAALSFALPSVRCANTPLLFTGVPAPDILDIAWDFGDPASGAANIAAGDSAYHAFPGGAYTITATTRNLRGCTAVTSNQLTVSPNLLAGNIAPAMPTPLCEGQTLTLTAPPGATGYLWSESGATTPTLSVSESGLYGVTLTDAEGCTYAPPDVRIDVIAAPETVIKGLVKNDLGQIIGVAYPQMNTCFGEDVHLITQGAGNYSYTWTTGSMEDEQLFSDTRDNLLNIGTHVFYVTITDNATGCTAVSDPFISVVNPVPAPFTISQSAFPACAGAVNLLSLNGAPEPNTQYVWNTGAIGPALSTTEPGTYRLRAINQFGCEAVGDPLSVLAGPNVRALPSGCHARCKPDTLCLPPLPDVIAWQWYQDGLPVPGATSAQFIAQESGTYWAALTDITGCTAQSDPLRLDLYDGFGNILGEVWSDVNNNGLIDAADTLVRQGVDIRLWQNNATVGSSQSGANGSFAFTNIPSANYVAAIDTAALPAQWNIVIGAAPVALAGCNATAQARLLLRFACQAAASVVQLQSCAGDSLIYNGVWLQAGDHYDFMLTTALGCDSLVSVAVSTLPTSAGTLNAAVCPGGFYDYNGTLIPAGQSQVFTLDNYLGCDSVLTVNVATLPASAGTLNAAACPGDAYDYNGTLIPAGQSQVFTLDNYLGCDSVLTVNVATLPASAGTLNAAACPGGAYDYNGTLIPAGQSQIFTLDNYLGCDSVLTVNVATLPVYNQSDTVAICSGTAYQYNGVTLQPGDTRTFRLLSGEGCDSTVTIHVTALPGADFAIQTAPSCSNRPGGVLRAVALTGGVPPFEYSLDGQNFQSDTVFANLLPGDYTLYLRDGNDCLFEKDARVNSIPALSVELSDAVLPCALPAAVLRPLISGDTAGLDIRWSNGARTPVITVTESGFVWVEVTNQCETVREEALVTWEEIDSRSLVYVPNVFAPAGSYPENDRFRPYFADGILISRYDFVVADRWGNLLFRGADPSEAWEGPFRSADMQPAVFVWYLEADIEWCGRTRAIRLKGDVTVVR